MAIQGRTEKKQVASTGKKPTSASASRFNLQAMEQIIVSQNELASWLGITNTQCIALWRQGILKRVGEATSDYNLKENVRLYIQRIKSRSTATEKAELELENLKQRNENLRMRNRDRRIEMGRQIAGNIVGALGTAMSELRSTLTGIPEAIRAIDHMTEQIGKANVEVAVEAADESEEVEGDEESNG